MISSQTSIYCFFWARESKSTGGVLWVLGKCVEKKVGRPVEIFTRARPQRGGHGGPRKSFGLRFFSSSVFRFFQFFCFGIFSRRLLRAKRTNIRNRYGFLQKLCMKSNLLFFLGARVENHRRGSCTFSKISAKKIRVRWSPKNIFACARTDVRRGPGKSFGFRFFSE